jgi:anti-anti-sigma factor
VISASVTAADGSVIAAVSRRVRPAGSGETGPEVVVSVRGDLDLDTAPLVQETLIQSLEGAERVCLDLAEVGFCGAAGVRVVITARQQAAARGRAFRLSGVHGLTERVLTLTGLYP